ncbi:MAG: NAD(P)H-binding protein [Pseudomonadota bacterium]
MTEDAGSTEAGTGNGPKRVFVLGATGTIGQATVRALVRRGHDVVCFLRHRAGPSSGKGHDIAAEPGGTVTIRYGDVTDPASLEHDGFQGEHFDALVSCMASRTGAPRDAWAIDHQAHMDAMAAAGRHGVTHIVLLSAICVQKPLLAFQHAKLAIEKSLAESGLTYSIVRPTAYFKSLAGQIDRLRNGKPFLVFGDGNLTACKPIGADDLGRYLAECLDDPARQNKILPIGGPGDAMTPLEQGALLFSLIGKPPRFRHVPVALLRTIAATLGTLGHIVPPLADKAELARIGLYYATESMLILDPATGRYDAEATPSFGAQTLADYYAALLQGEIPDERGEHAVF